MEDATRAGHIRQRRGESASSHTYSKMSESSGKPLEFGLYQGPPSLFTPSSPFICVAPLPGIFLFLVSFFGCQFSARERGWGASTPWQLLASVLSLSLSL